MTQPSPEYARQYDLFTGELIDTRTRAQKRADLQQQPVQTELFSTHEVLQFGVNGRPRIPFTDHTRLELEREDHRTEEQKERDFLRAADAQTYHLFPAPPTPDPPAAHRPRPERETQPLLLLPAPAILLLLSAGEKAALEPEQDILPDLMLFNEDYIWFSASQALRLPFSLI